MVQPAKQLLKVNFVGFRSLMHFDDEFLSSKGFVVGLIR
jgi:hypothetical protein